MVARRDERGASLVEYVLLVALIGVVCLLSLRYFGNTRDASLSKSASAIGGLIIYLPL